MKCAGCSSAVQRILDSRDDIARASVNLVTETAAIWPSPSSDAAIVADAAAATVSDRGFPTSVRPSGVAEAAEAAQQTKQAREDEIRQCNIDLAIAWTLAGVCLTSHLGHHLHHLGMHEYAHGELVTLIGAPWVGSLIAAVALAGPGRSLILEGWRALARGSPNMNSLVALGSTSAFALSALAVLLPALGWNSDFSEEPVMLLAVVLLGRALERQARNNASSDLRALASLLPQTSRLLVNNAAKEEDAPLEVVEVPTRVVRPGDMVQVLPGDSIPVDGK
eukprot:gene26625-32699_t